MDGTEDLWTAIRLVLPDAEELAKAVSADLGEPLDDVRLSVLIGTIALYGQLGPEGAAASAIGAELIRLESVQGRRPPSRLVGVESLRDLLAETRALETEGSLDLETIVAIQRTSGAIAARTDREMVVVLHRYAVTRRLMWEQCVAAFHGGRLEPGLLARFGTFLLLWNELTSLAVTEGYRAAEREILARDVEARGAALQELLGVVHDDPATKARLGRVALRHGLDPDAAYLLVAIAPILESGSMPAGSGTEEHELSVLAGRVGHLLGSTAAAAEGGGAGIRLPAVLPLMGRIAVLAGADWAGLSRLPSVLDNVLGGSTAAEEPRARPRRGARVAERQASWLAVASGSLDGVGSLAGAYADLVDAPRTAQQLGRRGWIADPEPLALERLLLGNRNLADAAVRRELGAILADERFGRELIETLQAYFDAGENVTATARSLHLATRTVGYRLEKVASLLGHPLDEENARRLATALLVYRLRSNDLESVSSRPGSSAIESGS